MQPMNPNETRLCGMLGMAHKAGRLSFGTERVLETIRFRRPRLVLAASDISENTRKRLINSCNYYSEEYGYPIEYREMELTMDALSHCLGQRGAVSCAALEDKGFTEAIKKLVDLCGQTSGSERDVPQEV